VQTAWHSGSSERLFEPGLPFGAARAEVAEKPACQIRKFWKHKHLRLPREL
jgi:hypothetical protein